MIDHDHVEAGVGRRLQGLERGDAAIDRDRDPRPGRAQAQKRRRVGAVALPLAVRHVNHRVRPKLAQEPHHKGGRGRAVHVVVSEDGDGLVLAQRLDQTRHGRVHVLEARGIGKRRAQGRGEKRRRGLQIDAARRQHPADNLGHAEALGERQVLARIRQALFPALAHDRALDAEETRPPFDRLGGQRHCRFVPPI